MTAVTYYALKVKIPPQRDSDSVTKQPPAPGKKTPCSSIIRPELILMHFTAEVGKPYP